MRGQILPRDGAGHSTAVPVQDSEPPELIALLNSSTRLLAPGSKPDPAETPAREQRVCPSGDSASPLPKEGSTGGLYSPLEKAAIYGPFLLPLCTSDTPQQHSENAVFGPREAEHLQHRHRAAQGGPSAPR